MKEIRYLLLESTDGPSIGCFPFDLIWMSSSDGMTLQFGNRKQFIGVPGASAEEIVDLIKELNESTDKIIRKQGKRIGAAWYDLNVL